MPLDLVQTQVTDAGLRHLADLPKLEELYSRYTAVTDEGLKHVGRLQSLKVLELSGTEMSVQV